MSPGAYGGNPRPAKSPTSKHFGAKNSHEDSIKHTSKRKENIDGYSDNKSAKSGQRSRSQTRSKSHKNTRSKYYANNNIKNSNFYKRAKILPGE